MGAREPLKLAYEAARHAIDDQARVLEGLRSRAGTLLAATALVTSFLGGQALTAVHERTRAADLHLWSFTALALALFVALAILTFAILLPYRLRFSVSAG